MVYHLSAARLILFILAESTKEIGQICSGTKNLNLGKVASVVVL